MSAQARSDAFTAASHHVRQTQAAVDAALARLREIPLERAILEKRLETTLGTIGARQRIRSMRNLDQQTRQLRMVQAMLELHSDELLRAWTDASDERTA